ncbi:unnamed protein product [Fusarium graminearum]|nr:unnamed protein product [Fusarium graminearum]
MTHCANLRKVQEPEAEETCEDCRQGQPEPVNNEIKQHLPTVVIISTGGTITGKGSSPTDTTKYESGAIDIGEVIKPVESYWSCIANVVVKRLFKVDSINLDISKSLTLNREIQKQLQEAVAVIVTMGTDTQAAYGRQMQAILPSDARVILIGSFKPHTAMTAEGSTNILAGVKLAVDPRWTGVLILSDRIMRPFKTLKKDSRFVPGEGALLAEVKNFEPRFVVPEGALKLKATQFVDISGLSTEDPLPEVEPILVYAGCNPDRIICHVERGVKAIILETFSEGYWPENSAPYVTQMSDEVIFVATSRHDASIVSEPHVDGVLAGGDWTTDELQLVLPLLIKLGWGKEKIQGFLLGL